MFKKTRAWLKKTQIEQLKESIAELDAKVTVLKVLVRQLPTLTDQHELVKFYSKSARLKKRLEILEEK